MNEVPARSPTSIAIIYVWTTSHQHFSIFFKTRQACELWCSSKGRSCIAKTISQTTFDTSTTDAHCKAQRKLRLLDFHWTPTCLAYPLHGNVATLPLQRHSVCLWVRVAKNLKREREIDGERERKRERLQLLSFLCSNASPSEGRKSEKGSSKDIELGFRQVWISGYLCWHETTKLNSVQLDPLFSALKLALFQSRRRGKINSACIDINVQHYASKWNHGSGEKHKAFINNMCWNQITF